MCVCLCENLLFCIDVAVCDLMQETVHGLYLLTIASENLFEIRVMPMKLQFAVSKASIISCKTFPDVL